MVNIHRISSGNVNCYIVVDKDKAILIEILIKDLE